MAVHLLNANAAADLALDANALSALKQQARSAPGEALGKAAGQFEAVFLQMVLKQMRSALPQDGPLTSDATKNYTAMFDQQLAQQLSNRGVGLKKIIEQQLARHMAGILPSTDDVSAPATPSALPAAMRAVLGAPVVKATKALIGGAVSGAPQPDSATGLPSKSALPTAASQAGLLPAGIETFIAKLRPHAEAAAKMIGVPAHYLLAQAGLETGWGKSLPRTAGGENSFNLFGIKAGRSWTGKVVEASTTEYVDGQGVHSTERFRAYGSYTEAFQDFAKLLVGNGRYAGALAQAGDPRAYAQGLQRGGYATDPNYGAKLVRSIDYVGRKLGLVGATPTQVAGSTADNVSRAI